MTVSVETETTIGRPAADVFEALTAVERYPEWLIASGIVGVERLDGGPLRVGSKLRISQTVAGRSTMLDGAVTSFNRDAAFGLRGKDKDGVTIEIDAALAPDGSTTTPAAATTLRWSVRIGLPLRYRMFESMVTPQARRAAILDLEALKRRLESVAQG
ncbi:MAG: SRPBCC family protein [Chloroflexi bacterium]|nr:SRPBCC family protein [Chloroflexota bacterium]